MVCFEARLTVALCKSFVGPCCNVSRPIKFDFFCGLKCAQNLCFGERS